MAEEKPALSKAEGKSEEKKDEKPTPKDNLIVTKHTMKIGGREVKYTVTAGTIVMKEEAHDREKEAEGEAAKVPGRLRRAYNATKGHIGGHAGKYGLGAGIAAGAGGALLARKLLAKKASDILAEAIEKDAEGGAGLIRRAYDATKGHIGRHTGKYGLGAGAAAGAGGALLARKLLAKKGK